MSEPITIEQAAAEAGLGDPTGVVLLYGEQSKRGRVRGWMQHGEHAGPVDVDLSRMDDRGALLRSRRHPDCFLLTGDFHKAVQALVGGLLDTAPDRTISNLRRLLGGEEEADRFLTLFDLLEKEASREQ